MASTHLAVLGSPIAHSKSPLIHTAAYKVLGLDWDYGRFEMIPSQLNGFLSLRDKSWRGLSLTMPLKESAHATATALAPTAERSGVVNTLLNAENGWIGFNTDIFGIQKALEHLQSKPSSVAVVGSGSTAASALIALGDSFPDARMHLYARDTAKARALLERLGIDAQVKTLDAVADHEITVSTLPSGAFLTPGQMRGILLDVAYNPWPSAVSRNYETAISGLEMLLWQALAQIRIFVSGDPETLLPNEDAVLAAMRAAL